MSFTLYIPHVSFNHVSTYMIYIWHIQYINSWGRITLYGNTLNKQSTYRPIQYSLTFPKNTLSKRTMHMLQRRTSPILTTLIGYLYRNGCQWMPTCWQYVSAMLLKSLDDRFSRFSSNLLLFIFKAKLARSISVKIWIKLNMLLRIYKGVKYFSMVIPSMWYW